MPIPIYFPCPGFQETRGAYFDPRGNFYLPNGTADILSVDDRFPLPKPTRFILSLLQKAMEAVGAEYLYFDVEKNHALIEALSPLCPVLAPVAFCEGTNAIPVLCYQPKRETFSDFTASVPNGDCWLRLSPVDAVIAYPDRGNAEQGEPYFSSLLQCNILASHTDTSAILTLFDTRETYEARLRLLENRFVGAIACHFS